MSDEYKPDISTIDDEIATNNAILSDVDRDFKEMKDEYVEKHRPKILDTDLTIFPKPNKSCGHCYGRGVQGWDHVTKEVVVCSCIKNKVGRKDVKLLTYGELREILDYTKKLFNLEETKYENFNEDIQEASTKDALRRIAEEQRRVASYR